MSEKSASFFDRLKSIPKALSMWGVGALASSPWWLDVLEWGSKGWIGEDAQKWALAILGVLTALGWAVPQKSIPK